MKIQQLYHSFFSKISVDVVAGQIRLIINSYNVILLLLTMCKLTAVLFVFLQLALFLYCTGKF